MSNLKFEVPVRCNGRVYTEIVYARTYRDVIAQQTTIEGKYRHEYGHHAMMLTPRLSPSCEEWRRRNLHH